MNTTPILGLKQPEATDPVTALRQAIVDNADITEENLEYAFSTWKPLERWTALIAGGTHTSGLTYFPAAPGANLRAPDTAAYAFYAAHIDPIDLDAGSRDVNVRASVRWSVNDVAPGRSFTACIRAVASTSGGASGSPSYITTLGTPLGLQTQAAPSDGDEGTLQTSPVTIAAAGDYVVGITVSGPVAAGSIIGLRIGLDYQQA